MDGAEALAARKLDAPPGRDPEPVLLVVDRNHPVRAAVLGEEGIETVERGDVEHAHPAEVARKCGDAVAVIARNAGRIDARSAVEREGVKPERHLLDGRASDAGSTSIGNKSATSRSASVTMYRPSTSRRTIATRLSPRSMSPAPSPPKPRRDSIALLGASRGLVQSQRAGGRRVDALVPVIPADSIPREGIVPHNRFHHTAAGGATGRLRLDKDVISRRQSRDYPSVDSAPEGTLATPHRRAAEPQRDRAHRPLVAEPTAGRSEPVLVGGARCSGLRGR
jgi:hypothetical protein